MSSAILNYADYANNLYSAYHSSKGSCGVTPEQKAKLDTMSREDFVADMMQTLKESWEPGGVRANQTLYAGSSVRARLSDAEVAVLANKYDFLSMNQEDYDAFLDDLESMGAVSEMEKGFLGYKGLTTAGYFAANGELVFSESGLYREGLDMSDGNVVRWLAQRAQWKTDETCEALNDIVSRMAAMKSESGEPDAISQILDPNSKFYEGVYNRMKLQLQRSEEEKEKQAIIDALDAILESLSARKDDYPRKKTTVRSMAELSQVADSLDKDDPRKEQLNLLRERLQQLGIYADLDVGVKDEDENWETLTESLIREETEEPNLSDII